MKKVMTKVLLLAGFAAMVSLAACSEITTPEEPATNEIQLDIKVSDIEGNVDTKAVKSRWENGDKIYIWYDENVSANPDLVIKYNGSTWATDKSVSVSGKTPAASGILKYAYTSSNNLESLKATNYSTFYSFSYPNGSSPEDFYQPSLTATSSQWDNTSNSTYDSYMVNYTYSNGVLSADLNKWFFSTNLQIVVPGLSGNSGDWYLKVRTNVSSLGPIQDIRVLKNCMGSGFSRSSYVRGMPNADGVVFYVTSDSPDTYNIERTFSFYLTNGEKTYLFKKELVQLTVNENNSVGITKQLKALVLPSFDGEGAKTNWKNGQIIANHYYVDLGIVIDGKRIMWAETNVGANTEDAAGTKYAWGERETKTEFTWNNYKYSDGSSSSIPKMTKYVTDSYYGTVDNLSELQPTYDDAARANWKEAWRIPTAAEISALLNNCTWTWQSSKDGWKVTGKNGNSIFIPDCAGYWTATLDSNNGRKATAFMNDGENSMYMFAGDRKNGYYIRPVLSKN